MEEGTDFIVTKAADCLLTLTSIRPAKEIAFDKQTLKRLTQLLYRDVSSSYVTKWQRYFTEL